MKRSKKLFFAVVVLFFGAVAYLGYDISRMTTFPGSKPQLKERLIEQYADTTEVDTLRSDLNPKN